MSRICFLCVLATTTAFGQGLADPAFDNVPFDDWLKGGGEARIDWFFRVSPANLSERQLLETYIQVNVAAHEFVKRPERGQMIAFLEIRNRDNQVFRKHWRLLPAKDQTPDARGYVRFGEHTCIVPGDYEIAVAIYDSESKKHNLKHTRFRVPALPHDPFGDTWRELTSVEFSNCGAVNSSRLSVPLMTDRALRIEVVVNRSANRNRETGKEVVPGALMSSLATISAMEIPNGSMHVTVLDVERRKVNFSGEMRGKILSRRLRAAFGGNDPYRIDAHSLQGHAEDAQFFVSEIRKRLESPEFPDTERVLIVLSPPLALPKDVDMRPIEVTPASGTRVFYVRTSSVFFGYYMSGPGRPTEGPMDAPPSIPTGPSFPSPPAPNNHDSLERTLKPLKPTLFDVITAADFRHALGVIVREISQQK